VREYEREWKQRRQTKGETFPVTGRTNKAAKAGSAFCLLDYLANITHITHRKKEAAHHNAPWGCVCFITGKYLKMRPFCVHNGGK